LALEQKAVLVTGGAGFIGSHLVDRLIDEEPGKLVVVDDFYLGEDTIRNLASAKNRFPKLKIHHKDATKMRLMKDVLKKENIDVVFDLAVVCLPVSLIRPKWTYDTNVEITSTFCELLRKGSYETMVHFSSSEAYGDAQRVPMSESHPLRPTTAYGASKIASDHLILSYISTYGIDASIVRPFNTYGPRQHEGTYAGVIPLTIRRILSGKSPIVYGDGLQTRDYTFVTDVADAAVKICQTESTRGKVINIASGEEMSIKNLISKIAKIMKYDRPIIYEKPRPGDVRRFVGSNSLVKKLIKYEPKVGFEQGLGRTVDWYRALHAKGTK
jgi:UDP-glucose 4-epimerase